MHAELLKQQLPLHMKDMGCLQANNEQSYVRHTVVLHKVTS